MAISAGTFANANVGATLTPTFPITVAAGDDRLLVVSVAMRQSTGVMPTVSTITYGSQSLSKTDGAAANMTAENVDDTRKSRVEIWKLVAPAVGTQTCTITFSAIPTAAVAHHGTFYGVDQTTPLGTAATATGDVSPADDTITITVDVTATATSELVIDAFADTLSTLVSFVSTAGSGQTELSDRTTAALGSSMSSEAGVAGTVTMSWDITLSSTAIHDWSQVGVPIKASSTTSPPVDASTTIAEVAVLPILAGPKFGSGAEVAQTGYERGGAYAKVSRVHMDGESYVWDDYLTLPSVAPAGKIAVSAIPTPNSPNGSLVVTTQDRVLLYPLPYTGEPSLTENPDLATSGGNDLVPVFYPQPVVLDGVYTVGYIDCYGENFVEETDSWGMSFKWDENNAWETVQSLAQNHARFRVPDQNKGTVLHTAFTVNDGANTDAIGPTGRTIVAWVRKLDEDASDLRQPDA